MMNQELVAWVDQEVGTGGPDPLNPEKHQNNGFLSIYRSGSLKIHNATKPLFNVGSGPGKWRFAGGSMMARL